MYFESPQYLLFLLLLVPLWKYLRVPGRTPLAVLRGLLVVIAVFVLARPHRLILEDGLDLLVLADRSNSIGSEGFARETELVQLLGNSKARGKNDRIGVISFADGAHMLSKPATGPVALGLDELNDPNASNIAAALELTAIQALPHRRTRVLLLSDGLYTGADPLHPELLGALQNTEIWYRKIGKARTGDVAAAGIHLPPTVEAGAGFLVRYSFYSAAQREVTYSLMRGDTVLASGATMLAAGLTHFVARDLAQQPGQQEYRLQVSAPADPEPANNVATGLVRVISAPRVLIASADGEAGVLAKILQNAAIPVDLIPATGTDWSPARLAPYRVVILENTPLKLLGPDGTKGLADAVENGVCALLVTGGEGSFGQGGYHKSALDPLLPVSMELRQEQRRGMMALVTVLDRSGSMSCPAGGGKTKMDLANLGTIEAIRMLSPLDQVSVIVVDSSPHVIVPLVQADDTGKLQAAVSRIESMGGGIFVRTGLGGAEKEIRKSKIPNRHIILFSDAADSEEQRDSVAFASGLLSDGITISVVALGTKSDCDASFLIDLAKAGGGEIYFTDRAAEIPRLFTQEVIRVSRRGFVKEPTNTKPLPDLLRLRLPMPAEGPVVSAYNLSSLRKDASCGLATDDEYKAPIAAFWQHGRASTGALLADLDGPYTQDLYKWKPMPELLVNMVRHLASGVNINTTATWSHSLSGEAVVRLEVDEQDASRLRAKGLQVRFLPPAGMDQIDVPLSWQSPTQAEARLTLPAPGHYMPIIDLGEDGIVRASPVSLPYSPEYLPRSGISGEALLDTLAQSTGGEEAVNIEDVFRPSTTIPDAARKDMTPWLVLLFLILLVVEMAEKRLALIDWIRQRRQQT